MTAAALPAGVHHIGGDLRRAAHRRHRGRDGAAGPPRRQVTNRQPRSIHECAPSLAHVETVGCCNRRFRRAAGWYEAGFECLRQAGGVAYEHLPALQQFPVSATL